MLLLHWLGLIFSARAGLYTVPVLLCFVVAVNVALRRPAVQCSTYMEWTASLAVDNNLTTTACTLHWSHTEPWLSIDLGSPMDVGRVCVTNHDHAGLGKPQLIYWTIVIDMYTCLTGTCDMGDGSGWSGDTEFIAHLRPYSRIAK